MDALAVENETLYQFILVLTGMILLVGYGSFFWWVKFKKSEKRKVDLESKFEVLESKVNNMHLESLENKLNPHLFKNILKLMLLLPNDSFCRVNKKDLIAIKSVQHFSFDELTTNMLQSNGKTVMLSLSDVYRTEFNRKIKK